MSPDPVDKPSVCPECGTSRGIREAMSLRWADWRRWLWPVLAVVWVVGLVVWENKDFLSRPASYSAGGSTAMPAFTPVAPLGISVGELRGKAEGGAGDELARALLARGGLFYSGHLEDRGQVAVVIPSDTTGSVVRSWGLGWPWGWADRSLAESYADIGARTGKVEGPGVYPAHARFRMLGVAWSRFPAGGWDHFSFDVQPLIWIVMLGWLGGVLALGVTRVARVAEERRRRIRQWAVWGVVGAGVMAGVLGFQRQEYVRVGMYKAIPTMTGLTRERVEALVGSTEADRVVARAMVAALGGVSDEHPVAWCYGLPCEWRVSSRGRAVSLPFVAVSEVEADEALGVPRAGVWHWSWMAGAIWGHSADGKRAMYGQVWLDQLLWWFGPVWVLCVVVPWVLGRWRHVVARRRVRRGLCGSCGYQLETTAGSTGTEITANS